MISAGSVSPVAPSGGTNPALIIVRTAVDVIHAVLSALLSPEDHGDPAVITGGGQCQRVRWSRLAEVAEGHL